MTRPLSVRRCALSVLVPALTFPTFAGPTHSVARQWNEELLEAIRRDYARPTVHARNLFHTTIAMWDSWAIYDDTATPYLLDEQRPDTPDVEAAREETMSYACFRILTARFGESPGSAVTLPALRDRMVAFGYEPLDATTVGNSPTARGNRIAITILAHGFQDLSNEQDEYAPNNGYAPVNPPMYVEDGGTSGILNPNRWQPLSLEFFVDQGGNPIPIQVQEFLGPHWGRLPPFAMTGANEGPADVWFNPDKPPYITTPAYQATPEEDMEYRDMFTDNVRLQSVMSPDLPATIDISPGTMGNNTLGTNDGTGHDINPFTGLPYESNVVKLGDWSRCISEFWADGPSSETPPGHWNTLANYVTDNTAEKRIGGTGPIVSDLEWDTKLYLALNGAVYDAAVAAWGIKGHYDYVRPISAIRFMAENGQSSDSGGPSYHPQGILLEPGVVEVITAESDAPGKRHAHLAGHIGQIAVLAWPGVPFFPDNTYSGVEWILATDWVPYQRDTFVTPPFAGYISGHSTFSRAAAEILTSYTGSMYFPGGLGEFQCPANEFLVFEDGPSETVVLQWATYYDASDESGISRLYGGIHPRVDDFPGRIIGAQIGQQAWDKALQFYAGTATTTESQIWRIF